MEATAGLNLKIEGLQRGLKQYELEAHLGISQALLSQIETGRRTPSLELMRRVNEILGTGA